MSISEWADMMPHTFTLHHHLEYNKVGDLVSDSQTDIKCYIEGKARRVTDRNGTEKVSMSTLYCHTTIEVSIDDRATLPVGFNPRERLPIINVQRLSDENGVHHVTIFV